MSISRENQHLSREDRVAPPPPSSRLPFFYYFEDSVFPDFLVSGCTENMASLRTVTLLEALLMCMSTRYVRVLADVYFL